MNRTTSFKRVATFVGLAVVLPVGLVLGILGSGGGLRIVGGILLLSGAFLLLSPRVFTRDSGEPPTADQIAAEQHLRLSVRSLGATGLLMGSAQFVPDERLRLLLTLSAAAVAVTAAVRTVWRGLAPTGDAAGSAK